MVELRIEDWKDLDMGSQASPLEDELQSSRSRQWVPEIALILMIPFLMILNLIFLAAIVFSVATVYLIVVDCSLKSRGILGGK